MAGYWASSSSMPATVIIPCLRLGMFLFHSFVSVGADDEPRGNVGKIAIDVVTVATIVRGTS
jgi:hypothetical protein